jgi:hypothetical protein
MCVIVDALDELLWEVIDEIGDLEDTEHELQPVLSTITDMYERYERDIPMDGKWNGMPLSQQIYGVKRVSKEVDDRIQDKLGLKPLDND